MDPHTVGILLGIAAGALTTYPLARISAARALRNRPTAVSSPECPHVWSLWQELRRGDVTRSSKVLVGTYVELARTCEICGDVDLKEVRTNA